MLLLSRRWHQKGKEDAVHAATAAPVSCKEKMGISYLKSQKHQQKTAHMCLGACD
jgi:hypothetical protein